MATTGTSTASNLSDVRDRGWSGPKLLVGQRVEVLAFDTPGAPGVWMRGTITALDRPASGGWDVEVDRDKGKVLRLMVAKRGGNKYIQAL